ncbi:MULTISPECIES: SAM-dependent methyltransferase [unclassified Streptomyces]|uniref:SAM-dependent methyltransferase n=1 Tax=unclassified Streptomyces TaxID=2593676 RepID=UPI0009401ECB|nr:SAM-dependent methyltransferase [Streptomyces sp. TSRI0281]OKI45323.1 hypothetical protein A6A29_32345 [Streptomyces sp. TSRI0281]
MLKGDWRAEHNRNIVQYGTAWAPATPVRRHREDWATVHAGARLYEALLGGSDHYAADRDVLSGMDGKDFIRLRLAARINLQHNALVARYLAQQGFDQFLDLGCGLPSPMQHSRNSRVIPDVHTAVFGVQPDARVIYVDVDHVVIGRRRMATEETGAALVQGDLRDMGTLLASDQVCGRLDLTRPVAVLMHDVLPWVADPDATEAVRVLRDWAPSGSALSITHAADLGSTVPSKLTPLLGEVADLTYSPREAHRIEEFFGAWRLLDPGLVPTHQWHPKHSRRAEEPQLAGAYAGVGIKEDRAAA